MAFALVNPVSALWQRRGLTTLLMPEGHDAFAAPQQEVARAVAANAHSQTHTGQTHTGQPARERQPWQQPWQKSGQQQHPRPASPTANSGAQTQRRPHTAAGPDVAHPRTESAPAAEPGKAAAWLPLPPHVWPSPWQARLQQTRPGPVLWTYWNLGPDLCDPQTPGRLERRQFLQRLLHDLGHPTGTHTFWPSCLPPDPDALPPAVPPMTENGYAANADVFWSGAAQLRARGVVVMGSAAANAVALPSGLRPPQQIRHRGRLVWVLWDVDNLLQFDQRYASMLALLREALRHILR
ncbi:MAG: hypothetical protein QM795_15455 [Pseudoxanthomonas sp.]